jgi:hypothetical protein
MLGGKVKGLKAWQRISFRIADDMPRITPILRHRQRQLILVMHIANVRMLWQME